MEPTRKPENVEFEPWMEDMSPIPLRLGPVTYEPGLFHGVQPGSANGSNDHFPGIESTLEQLVSRMQRRVLIDGAGTQRYIDFPIPVSS
jgi:hypothetical protein